MSTHPAGRGDTHPHMVRPPVRIVPQEVATMNPNSASLEEQVEANTARILVQNETIIGLLERLLEASSAPVDFSGSKS